MPGRRIPTYAEIASFRESLIKTRKQLELDELEKLHGTLVRMEFDCLRAIPSLNHRSDQDLMERARERARQQTLRQNATSAPAARHRATAGHPKIGRGTGRAHPRSRPRPHRCHL